MNALAGRSNRLRGTVLALLIAITAGACSAGEPNAVDPAETRASAASTTTPDAANAVDGGQAPGAGSPAGTSTPATSGTAGSARANGNAQSGPGASPRSTDLEDPPDTMPGRTYDPAAVGLMREHCMNMPTAEFFKNHQRAPFADFEAWFPMRPLARTTSLPAGDHREVVFVKAGDEDLRGRQGDPNDSFGTHVLWTGRDPDHAPVKELLEAGGAMVMYASTQSPYARRDQQEPVVVRSQPGGISQRRWFLGCVDVDHWDVDWAAPASQGGYVYMRVYLSAKQFTRAQALKFCEAMENSSR